MGRDERVLPTGIDRGAGLSRKNLLGHRAVARGPLQLMLVECSLNISQAKQTNQLRTN